MQAKDLYQNYREDITRIISQITELKAAGVAFILSDLATDVVPQMMVDVGKLRSLSGDDKKKLILDTLDLAITEVFRELNEKTSLKDESWDEVLRDVLKKALPKIIDLLVKVEKDKLVFNKRISGCFSCCRS